MCCGYRVLSAPSLLAIDFTVFVRFIPFYFHQGKLGCQDLLTRNKPLSLSWLSPSRAGCKVPPGSVCQGRRLPAFMRLSRPPCLSCSGCRWIQLTNLQRTKPGMHAWSDVRIPLPCCLPKAQRWCAELMQSHWKVSPSHVLVTNHDTPRAVCAHCQVALEVRVCAWRKMTYTFKLKCNTYFSTYFLTVFLSACFMRKKQNIKRENLKSTGI